jgi:hypothetical protein
MKTPEEIIAENAKYRRVCPQPTLWNDLWNLLPDRRRVGAGWEPALPLILAAWHHSSDSEKRDRFLLHLKWAESHEAMEAVTSFLDAMTPGDWHTTSLNF